MPTIRIAGLLPLLLIHSNNLLLAQAVPFHMLSSRGPKPFAFSIDTLNLDPSTLSSI